MPPKKKNHFVPQFYFRNFVTGDAISLFNIARKLHIPAASIARQCQRGYLYGKETGIEEALSELEGRVSEVVRDLIRTEKLPEKLSPQYIALVTYINLQMSRAPRHGAEMTQTMTAMFRAAMRDNPSLPTKLRAGLDSIEVTHENPVLFQMGISGKYAVLLHDLKPVLIRNDSGIPFVTSDSPVVAFNQWAQDVKHRGVLGTLCAGLQLFLPLSPKLMLLLYDDGVYTSSSKIRLLRDSSAQALNALQLSENVDNLYFDGTPSTLDSIQKLPFHWLPEAKKSHKLVEAESVDDPSSKLLHMFQAIVGQLNIPEIRIRNAAKSATHAQRGNSYRPLAKYAFDMMERGRELPPPPRKAGLFRAVREDEIEIE